MSRLWDTPEFWACAEADELLRDSPTLTADALADRFEQSPRHSYGDPQFVCDLVVELRKRTIARVRFWPVVDAADRHQEISLGHDADFCDGDRAECHEIDEPLLADGARYWWQRM